MKRKENMYVVRSEKEGLTPVEVVLDDLDKAFEHFRASERLGFSCSMSHWE